jgi:crossover junction endodeoxyribonuclease RuvC
MAEDMVTAESFVIGIDPGIKGAVCIISRTTRKIVLLRDTPTIRVDGHEIYNIDDMAEIIRQYLRSPVSVWIEQAQSMPGQGVKSMYSIGRGFGIWEGITVTCRMPLTTVRPHVWTRSLFMGSNGQGKERSIKFALEHFPGIELTPKGCRTPKDGRADAACLAYYGLLREGGYMA